MIRTEVCIVGAGPGGVATALKLSYLGISSVLIEKAVFPWDKICGDAISGKVTTLLNRLDPEIMKRFNARPIQSDVWGVRFVAPNGKELNIPFKANYVRNAATAPGYVSRRMDFDHFLIEEVKRRDNIRYYEGVTIQHFEKIPNGFVIKDKTEDFCLETHILIDASGAHSRFSRSYAGLEKDKRHHAGSVRAYFRNVKQLAKDIEG